MKKLIVLLFALLVATACSSSSTCPIKAGKVGISACKKCGEFAGSKKCCAKDIAKCGGCGLNKGSVGCCKLPKNSDGKICTKCGEFKGTAKCCAKDAKKCGKCGLNKGSAACCKL